jgi:1,4-alpha-glucan branching enzyme
MRRWGRILPSHEGDDGCYFAVWAPSAHKVEVIGDFNYWGGEEHPLYVRWDESGIWEGFIPYLKAGDHYKFKIYSNHDQQVLEKADPFARRCEAPPRTASIIADIQYEWKDEEWLQKRFINNALNQPFSVYEVHLGSWKWDIAAGRALSYRQLADDLVTYVKEMNFTHVEFMPITAYPYDPSLGISGDWIFCSDRAIRFSGRPKVSNRPIAPGRHWGITGLGTRALSFR